MDIKDEFVQNVLEKLLLSTSLPKNMIDQVENYIRVVMANYDMSHSERALVAYDYSDIELMQKFILAKAVEGLSKRSLDTYGNVYKKFFRETQKHIKSVTTEDIRVYMAKLKIDGVSTNYLNLIKRALSSLYTWLVEEDFIAKNPVAKIKSIKNKKIVKLPLSDDEMEVLRAACHTK